MLCRWVRTLRSVVMYRTQGAPAGSVTACASSSSCVQKWCVRAGWILSQATWVQCTRHRHQQVSRVNVCDSMIFLDPCRDISARSPLPATAGRPLRSVAKATAAQPLKKMAEMNMLAGWITVEMARPFGMVIDGSNNSLQDVSAGSAAEAVGLEAGDLIVAIDGTRITQFEMRDGPREGTIIMTCEPEASMGAQAAVDPNASFHSLTLLRELNPAVFGKPVSPPQVEQIIQPPPSATPSLQQQPSRAQPSPPSNPLEHYPWATEIQLPDATFGATMGESIKAKYNLPFGTALPPMQTISKTADAYERKKMFSDPKWSRPT